MRTNMKKTLMIAAVAGIAGTTIASGAIADNMASGLSYQDSVDVTFTINPSVSISLSSSDLLIPDLAPGSSSDSNVITVTASSNASAGYKVSSSVGDSTYNTTNLKHANSTDTNVGIFKPLTTTGILGDGEWGYNYSTTYDATSSDWTSWKGYTNLPLYNATPAELINTSTADSTSFGFKIGAKAKDAQIAGDYNNVINFIATANPVPDTTDISTATYMQEVDSCPATLETGKAYALKDDRDGQDYTVAKLADGKCWMTENLNIAGGTALSVDDTDFDSAYTLPTTNGWATDGGKLVLPTSSTVFGAANNVAKLYNSGNKADCGSNASCYSYYSWDAATLGSGRSVSTDDVDAPYSICPKNWKLPTSRSTVADNSDFYQLAVAYNMNSADIYENPDSVPTFYSQAGPNTAPNFLPAGLYDNSSFYAGGSVGIYWSSTSNDSNYARYLNFGSDYVYSARYGVRRYGASVRCVFGGQP